MNQVIFEKTVISEIRRHLPRKPVVDSPCDVELVDFDPAGPSFLAVTADSICEEIASGLYSDPYIIGWVLVMVSASDLAAAGASALGVVVTLGLPEELEGGTPEDLGRGIGDACRSIGTISLGGDTNTASELTASSCAIGLVPKDRVLTRVGAHPGDVLYLSGRAGLGNAYALSRFMPETAAGPFPFLPRARLKMGRLVAEFASCAMDTSDGVVATLDELSRVNQVGFAITVDPACWLHPRALAACDSCHIPRWLALAGCQGEFELAFTVPAASAEGFLDTARERHLSPKCIGHVTEERGVFLSWGGRDVQVDSGWIRNLAVGGARDARRYISDLVAYAQSLPV